MIVSFGDAATADLYHGRPTARSRRFPPSIRVLALQKLDVLNATGGFQDLRSPPGNRLEALRGDLRGFHSIRIDRQWRIVFRRISGDAHEVRVTDYHWCFRNHEVAMLPAHRVPTHPGVILQREFLIPHGLSQVALAAHIGVPVQRINEVVRGRRGITPETAWLLAQAFGTTPQLWINLQSNHDLASARPRRRVGRLRKAG